MGTINRTVGFTIIETMMFLAITGLLAVGILAGTGAAISQQRYKDSVNSLQSFIQDQFSKVTNVTNGRDNTWRCHAGVAEQAGGEPRGTGDCVILGRLVRVDGTGKGLSASDVVGEPKAGVDEQSTDIDELIKGYDIAVSPINAELNEVAWDATIVQPGSDSSAPQPTSILIIRSPLSGRIMTFVGYSATASPAELIGAGLAATPTPLCVVPSDGLGGVRLGVRISAFAASQSAVQIAPESEGLCA